MDGSGALHVHVVAGQGPTTRLLFAIHGYGMTEIHIATLVGLADPHRRFTVVAPRGPLPVPRRDGAAWVRPRRRHPEQFGQAFAALDALLEEQCAARGVRRADVVLAGFSQGAILAFALATAPGRPAPAGVLSWSGTLPLDRGVDLDLAQLAGVPVLSVVGTQDAVIPIGVLRSGADQLRRLGALVEAVEHDDAGHDVTLEMVADAKRWLAAR